VLVAWSDPGTVARLDGNVLGVGGPTIVSLDDHEPVAVSGRALLDRDELAAAGADVTAATVLHELAHVLGADHVDDPGQLMHPDQGRGTLGDGDRVGLAALGAGRCAPEL
jgi:hypothetical protein